MAKVIKLVTSYDKRCKVVARTFLQGGKILDEFSVPLHLANPAKQALAALQRRLLRCYQIWESLQTQVDEGKNRAMVIKSKGRPARIPAVIDLDDQCESFLDAARFAMHHCLDLAAAFGVKTFEHNIDKCISWCTNHYGKEHGLTKFLTEGAPYVRLIYAMRNSMRNPAAGDKLHIDNFTWSGTALVEPCWRLNSEKRQRIEPSMANIMEVVLRFSEGILAACVIMSASTPFPLRIIDIPEPNRDPACPIRLTVGVSQGPTAT